MRALLVVLTGGLMVAVSACATTPSPPPPSVDVSGTWVGRWSAFQGSGGGELRGMFLQDRDTLHGQFDIRNPNLNRTYVAGIVSGNEIKLFAPDEGTLVVNGDEMTGTFQEIKGRIQLRRESLPPLPPPSSQQSP
jgi:hypothetical protein